MNQTDLANYRIQRLQAAIDQACAGNKTAFGRKLGFKDGAFVRQMLNAERAISEKTVRAIESMHGMTGWFSPDRFLTGHCSEGVRPTPQVLDWPLQMATPDRFYALTPVQAEMVDKALDAMLQYFEIEHVSGTAKAGNDA